MRRSSIALMLAAGLVGAGSACSVKQRASTETALARALVSDQEMAQIGAQVHSELESKGVRYVGDPAVTRYVESVAGRIFDLARRDRPGVDYHVHVIDDPKTVNAFATPGAHLFVYSGLLLAADNEAELAGVLAHETGHVVGRHVERALVNQYGVSALATLALGQNPSLAKQLAASVLGTGILRAHSRSEETEADEYGARYASALDYDPHALITFFQKLQAQESRAPQVPAWLQTHPLTQDRIDHLNAYIVQQHLAGNVLAADRHHSAKERLVAR